MLPRHSMDNKTTLSSPHIMNFSALPHSPPSTGQHMSAQYPTPQREPLSPVHSRNSSMSKEFAALKAEPHRSIMGISNLITPPNSGEMKPRQTFHDDRSDTLSETDDIPLYSHGSPAQVSSQHLPLFTDLSPVAPFKAPAVQDGTHIKSIAASWSRNVAPDWNGMERIGIKRPHGVETWQELCNYEAARGNTLTRPAQEDYEEMLHFVIEMMARAQSDRSASPVVREAPKRRKVLQDGPNKRRSTSGSIHVRKTSTTPSLGTDKVQSPAARRRQAKLNGKVVGAEARSARAPSTKEPKDPNWRNYPDYAPSFASAPANVMDIAQNCRHFDNKDNKKGPRDLSNDPERSELNQAEIVVAEWLHLDCHRFHTSKRQIFQGYVRLLRKRWETEQRIAEGVEQRGDTKLPNWNKTEAQKLLGIDVSKGSWIWQFYRELGWFEPEAEHLYAKFLDERNEPTMIKS